MVFLSEPWINFEQIHGSFCKCIGLKPFLFNNRGARAPNIWCLCVRSLSPTVVYATSQLCAFSVIVNSHQFFISAIYASTAYMTRKDLWKDLSVLEKDYPVPGLFIGDFNATVEIMRRGVVTFHLKFHVMTSTLGQILLN